LIRYIINHNYATTTLELTKIIQLHSHNYDMEFKTAQILQNVSQNSMQLEPVIQPQKHNALGDAK